MEQIIQSIKNQKLYILARQTHQCKKQYPSDRSGKRQWCFHPQSRKSEECQFFSSSILLIIEPDFSTDVAEIVAKKLPMQTKNLASFFLCNQVNVFALPPLLQKKYTHIKNAVKI